MPVQKEYHSDITEYHSDITKYHRDELNRTNSESTFLEAAKEGKIEVNFHKRNIWTDI